MTHSLRQSSWILTVSVAAIAIVFLKFVWLPGHRAIQETAQQIEAKRAIVNQATGLSTALAAAKQDCDAADAVASRWKAAAPGHRDIPALFAKIDAMAKEAHLAVGRFDPQPAVVHETLQEIPINMTCWGTFAQIHEFLRGIEGMHATIWVESMRFEKAEKDAKDVKCELNLVVFSGNS